MDKLALMILRRSKDVAWKCAFRDFRRAELTLGLNFMMHWRTYAVFAFGQARVSLWDVYTEGRLERRWAAGRGDGKAISGAGGDGWL